MSNTGGPPATGPPRYRGPDYDKGYQTVIAMTVMGAASLLVVLLRLYQRIRFARLWWDDLFVVIALLTFFVDIGLVGVIVHYGGARNYAYLTKEQIEDIIKYGTSQPIAVIVSLMFGRISVCLFLLRVFSVQKPARWILGFIIFINVVCGVTDAFFQLLQCDPVRKNWDEDAPGHCQPPRIGLGLAYFDGGVSIVSDFALSVLPLVFMWNIKMRWRIKLGIWAVLSLGFFAGVCAIFRTINFNNLKPYVAASASSLIFWSILEMGMVIVAASMPAIVPLVKKRATHPESEPLGPVRGPSPQSPEQQREETKPRLRRVESRLEADAGLGEDSPTSTQQTDGSEKSARDYYDVLREDFRASTPRARQTDTWDSQVSDMELPAVPAELYRGPSYFK